MKYLTLLLFFISFYSFGQSEMPDMPIKEGKITYIYIDTLSGTNKEKLHNTLLQWIAKNANNSNHVIKLNDKEEGKILGKISFNAPVVVNKHKFIYNYDFNAEFTVKEDRYRVIFTDFTINIQGNSATIEQLLESIKVIENNPKNKSGQIMFDINKQSLVNIDNYSRKLLQVLAADVETAVTKNNDF
ncbi:hypothetical protein D3C87_664300 [compost metagenome]